MDFLRLALKLGLRPTVIEVLGIVALIAGLCLIWLPLGLIVGGGLVVFISQGMVGPHDSGS